MRLKLALLLALILPGVASAEIAQGWNLAHKYERNKFIDIYLAGALYGIDSANAQLLITGRDQLYCQPKKLALNAQNAVTIFEEELAQLKADGADDLLKSVTLEDVLLSGLMYTFPCDK